MIRNVLAGMVRLAGRAVAGRVKIGDPWREVRVRIPPGAFSSGSVRSFAWYLEGESVVSMASVKDICKWLRKCKYKRDPELFDQSDLWQHPTAFEESRKGDCEDHALWAWRKLIELGIDASLVCGRLFRPKKGTVERHAWVVFSQDGQDYLLETTRKKKKKMLRPLEEVRDRYRPEFSVDRHLKTHVHAGCLLSLREAKRPRVAVDRG